MTESILDSYANWQSSTLIIITARRTTKTSIIINHTKQSKSKQPSNSQHWSEYGFDVSLCRRRCWKPWCILGTRTGMVSPLCVSAGVSWGFPGENTPCYTPQTEKGNIQVIPLLPLYTDYAIVQYSLGTYPETSSHALCKGPLGHSHLSLLNHCELILV